MRALIRLKPLSLSTSTGDHASISMDLASGAAAIRGVVADWNKRHNHALPITGETPMPASLRRHNPPAVHPPLGRYHHATVHPLGNGLKRLVMAGQVGIKPNGTLAGDLAAQIEQAYDNLLSVLASEGMGPGDLVKITYFTT